MNKKIIYIGLGLLLGLGACNEEFLDRYPQTSVSPEEFFKSEEDLELYVNGLLSLRSSYDAYHADQSSDNMATTGAVEVKTMMTGDPSSQTLTSGWSWGRLRDINYFLDNYERADASEEARNHFAGLARYYRAMFYFNMVKRYSDLPWYSSSLNPDDDQLYKARDPRATVIENVVADLQFAVEHVRESVPSGTPDVWAVRAFLARVALYEGTYRKYHPELALEASATTFLQLARDMAQQIMDNGNFSLYTTGRPEQDYATLFSSLDLLGNQEVILANPYDVNKDRSGDINYTVFGDYEQSPSRDLLWSYLMVDGSRFTDAEAYQNKTFVEEFQDRDPRLSQTFAYPGWLRSPNTTPYIQVLNKNFSGYHQLKGYANTVDNIAVGSVDFPVYRYAEVLLTFAEARAELGELVQSDLDITINALRERAGMPGMSMGVANANPDPFLAAKYPQLSGANVGALLEIRRERRVEFALEGFRYDDLMRWAAGDLLENIPQGMYFPGLGKYDLTGDGVEDVILVSKDQDIPTGDNKEKNELGVFLIYYKAGEVGDNVDLYLTGGAAGGTMVTDTRERVFETPKYYYRPVPIQETTLNPNLTQIFGWD
ncbi:hypothetical protein GCM10007049_38360 [Echinicola pacifica]|uniref:Starch-binding associating with outer membrane n=1 Tax=Echinicola pacifica TaxID=346377 RepID=A0A918QCD4_9BACT|nr:RagB/SusD family nutrient uptake outer membrane protein [Echinicola pacifica]GGZ41409.1 hypothetical protein GCM10007049_38360 [Echinicola pacifica]